VSKVPLSVRIEPLLLARLKTQAQR